MHSVAKTEDSSSKSTVFSVDMVMAEMKRKSMLSMQKERIKKIC